MTKYLLDFFSVIETVFFQNSDNRRTHFAKRLSSSQYYLCCIETKTKQIKRQTIIKLQFTLKISLTVYIKWNFVKIQNSTLI